MVVLEALGRNGFWKRGNSPSPHSFVERPIDRTIEPEALHAETALVSYRSAIRSSRENISWSHAKGRNVARGTLRLVSDFDLVNSTEWARIEWTAAGLRAAGLKGFIPFDSMADAEVPSGPGVYVVIREPAPPTPVFLPKSTAGVLKGKDPTVSLDRLAKNWIPGSSVVYIGKADGGRGGRRGLKKRLEEFRHHGAGEPVGHWGGRLIWQLADSDRLLVCWLESAEGAEAHEARLLHAFEQEFQALPFANLKRGKTQASR